MRNLLIDAGHKIRELDTIREAFGKLVDPVNKTLRAYEEEKSEKISLQTALADIRASYNKARTDLGFTRRSHRHSKPKPCGCGRICRTRSKACARWRSTRPNRPRKMPRQRTQISDLQRRLTQETAEREAARDEARRFSERLSIADKRVVQLEADVDTAAPAALVAEREKSSLQTSLESATNDTARSRARSSRRKTPSRSCRAGVRQMETNLADANSERPGFRSCLRRIRTNVIRASCSTQQARFETLQSRATTTEKLLDEARAGLMARSEEADAISTAARWS